MQFGLIFVKFLELDKIFPKKLKL